MKLFVYSLFTFLSITVLTKKSFGLVVVTGSTSTVPNLSATYPTLNSAINALNNVTAINGPVTLTLQAGNSEIAPVGGYVISFTATSTFTNNVIIDGSNNVITSNSSLISGSLTDAIFKIIGSDFITIQNFIMQESASNNNILLNSNSMTEWGVAILHASPTNGSQNNIIKNNTIILNREYANTFGIYSNVRHSASDVSTVQEISNATTAPNKGNKIYSNIISNVSMGIVFIGSSIAANMDSDNDIGGIAETTGNTISNWGGNASTSIFVGNRASYISAYYGIYLNCQKSDNTSYNVLTSALLQGNAAVVRGIYKSYRTSTLSGTVTPTGTFSTVIDHNTITIRNNLPNNSHTDAILSENSSSITSTLSISNNLILNVAVLATSSNNQIRCINNNSRANFLYINNNIIRGTSSSSTNGLFTGIEQTGQIINTIQINDNIIGDTQGDAITYTAASVGASTIKGINNINTNGTLHEFISGNIFHGFVELQNSSREHFYITLNHTTSLNSDFHITNNTFSQIVAHTTNNVTLIYGIGIMALNAGAYITTSLNKIEGSFIKNSDGGVINCYRSEGTSQKGNTMLISENNFSDISAPNGGFATGIKGIQNWEGSYLNGPKKIIQNNIFKNWNNASGAVYVIYTQFAGDLSTISDNLISNISANNSIRAISFGGTNQGSMTCINNNVSNLNTPVDIFTIDIFESGSIQISKNKIFNLNVSNYSRNYGIQADVASTFTISIQNNYIGILNVYGGGDVRGINIIQNDLIRNININYNTIYLQTFFPNQGPNSISGVYLPTNINSTVSLRNNIIVNKSTPTFGGISSVIRRTGIDLTNYSLSSNNNVLYAGNPSPVNVIYYDGTNTDQTLSDFQNRVGPIRDNLSVSVMPDFISTNGDDNTFLHLDPTKNCRILNGGNNEGILLQEDFDADSRMTTPPFITEIGADERDETKTNVWTGITSSDWNTNSNWSLNIVPNDPTMNVYIPKAYNPLPQPIITSGQSWQVSNIFLESGISNPLINNQGKLIISGTRIISPISGYPTNSITGSIDNLNTGTVLGSLELNGGCPQNISGNIFVNNYVKDLTASNDVNISSTTGEYINISGELGFGGVTSKVLATGDNVTLISNESTTANLGKITNSNSIAGKLTVERYINTGISTGQHPKSWQFLATPTRGQSVYDSWQEGGNVPSGYGTIVTGTGSGFDITTTTPSMKYFDPNIGTSGDWVGVSNTSNSLYDQRGYMLFVRGDRNVTTSTTPANLTNMRSKGIIFQPNDPPPVTIVGAGSLASVGNPYASAVDLNYMMNASSGNGFTGLNNDVIVWDPLLYGTYGLGGYQTLSAINNYVPVAGGTSYYPAGVSNANIQSGQSFFVRSSGAIGTVKFTEDAKLNSNRLVNRIADTSVRKYFRAYLYTNTGIVADGNAVVFDSSLENSVDKDDAIKLLNAGENFIIKRFNNNLAVEGRKLIQETDTIFYNMSNLRQQQYQLKFAPLNVDEIGLSAKLVDNYLDDTVSINLKDSSFYNFSVNGDSLSYKDRFYVVFGKMNISSRNYALITSNSNAENNATNTSLTIYPNPVVNKVINYSLKNFPLGTYQLRIWDLTGRQIHFKTINIENQITTQSIVLPKDIKTGCYNISITGENNFKIDKKVIIN